MRRRTFLGGLAATTLVGPVARADGGTAVVVGGGLAACIAALDLSRTHRVVIAAEHGIRGATVADQGLWTRSDALRELLFRHDLDPFGTAEVEALRFADGEAHPVDGPGLRELAERRLEILRARGASRPAARLREGRKWLRHLDGPPSDLAGRPGTELPLTPWSLHADAWSRARLGGAAAEVDAAWLALAEHFHALDTDRARVRWLRGPADEVLWGPLRDALDAAGVELTPLPLAVLRDAPLGVSLGHRGAGVTASELELGWNRIEREDDAPVFLRRVVEGVEARSGRCPEHGGTLHLAQGTFHCPEGHELQTDALTQLYADLGAEGIVVEGELPERDLDADLVVLDQRHVGVLGLDPPRLRGELVVELVLSRDPPVEAATSAVLVDDEACHATWLHRTWGAQPPRVALRLGRSELDDEAARLTAETAIRRLYPTLADVRVEQARVHRGERTAYPPGFALLPRTPRPGVHLVGDAVEGAGATLGWEAAARSVLALT